MGRQTTIAIKSDLKIEQLVKQIINCDEKQVVLEVSEGSNLLNNEINLRLLKFYAEEEEKEIILKTADSALISLAQRLGISTVKESELVIDRDALSIHQEAENEIAAVPEISKQHKLSGVFRGGLLPAILVILFSLVLALWWFLLPRVVVTVYPKEEILPFETVAKIGAIFTNEDIADGKIPAIPISKKFSLSVQTVTTGQKVIGVTPAIGKVTFINSTNQPVVVPKGSALTAKDGTRFLTDNDVLVPKKLPRINQNGDQVGEDYGTADVGITAEIKGVKGNQPARSITKLDPKFQLLLKVSNPAPTKNGTDKKITIVTLEDTKKGEAEAGRQMQLLGPEELSPLVSSDSLFVKDLIKLEVIRVTNNPGIGQEGATVQTTLDYQASVLAPSLANIHQFLVKQLDLNLPPNFEAASQEVKLEKVKVASAGDPETKLAMVGKGKIRGILDTGKIKTYIKGKTIAEARQILETQQEIGGLKFNVRGEKARLPKFSFQIKVLSSGGTNLKK